MTAEENPEGRIEAALERIASIVESDDGAKADIADRLDRIIATVRRALGTAPGEGALDQQGGPS